jgi:ice-binding like protein/Big-like domain-containing protein
VHRLFFTVLCVCLLSMDAFAQTSGSPGGLVVFETFGSALAADTTQAGVLPGVMTTQTVLFASSSARLSRNLGVAIVNPSGTAASMTMTLRRGGDGTISSVKTIKVGARQQVAKFISELFSDVPELALDFDGSLSITSDYPVAIMALRFRGTNFSTIPITSVSPSNLVPPVSAGVGGPDAVILPQFAAGGSWSSEIVISNTTAVPLTVRVDLFKQDGTPLTTSLNGQSGSSFQNLVIPAEGILIQNTDDNRALQVGYAIVTPLDTIAPTVTSTVAANADFDVPINQKVTATFSESMDPSTISKTTFTLTQGSMSISGGVTYAGTTATFTPTTNLAPGTTFTATITTGAKDVAGNAVAHNFVWSFTTFVEPVPPPVIPSGLATVALGAAAPYAILAGAGVMNSGPTIINGSLGASPTGTLTGAPTVTGSTDLANPAAAAAKLALTAAYNDAAGRTLNAISLPGDLSGLTLAPGLYKTSSSVMLSAGNVTLDARGDPNATWIFQIGSTLTTISGTQVVLAGGAKAANIFWQVGSSATLGTTSIFKGSILSAISISANTGAVVEGRLLTQTGAVTLLSNVVTVPNP